MYLLFGLYALALTFIAVYCSSQVILWIDYRRGKGGKGFPNGQLTKANISDDLPFVTIQLPIFNELYVVERLIDNIVKMNYPKDKFQIHVLDDSTDETVEVTHRKVKEYQALGFDIQQITRTNRQGYKAGALKDATHLAKGDLIARVWPADRTGVKPVDYVAKRSGILTSRHFPGLIQVGDCLAVVAPLV